MAVICNEQIEGRALKQAYCSLYDVLFLGTPSKYTFSYLTVLEALLKGAFKLITSLLHGVFKGHMSQSFSIWREQVEYAPKILQQTSDLTLNIHFDSYCLMNWVINVTTVSYL